MTLIDQIAEFINTHQMLSAGERVLVSVSGGPDSVALLAILNRLSNVWNLTLSVVHFNHGLRGAESEEDARFVTRLCQQLHIPCMVKQLSMNSYDDAVHSSSLQEYARNVRYQELAHLARETGFHKVALGHTADDQAETMVMWMVRGAGTSGLSGIPPVRAPHVIRPLLGRSRSELMKYLDDQGFSFRMDSSNDQPQYWRNQVRQEVMPILKRYNPHVVRAMARQADVVREDDRYLTQLAHEAFVQVQEFKTERCLTLHRTRLMNLPLSMKRRVIRLAIQEMSGMDHMPSFDAIETVFKHIVARQSGTQVELFGVSIVREYEHLHVSPSHSPVSSRQSVQDVCQPIAVPSRVVWSLTGQTMEVSTQPWDGQHELDGVNRYCAELDAEMCRSPLVLRNWQDGDWFYPLGMGGKRKKLQDFFSDIKLKRSLRHTVPLLVAPEGIVWVGGYRLDHRFRVTDSTRTILVANLSMETTTV